MPSEKPNVVVIICDDLGYGDPSCQGGVTPTPCIDRLMHDGARLTDFHSTGVVCSPTRASLITGVVPQRCDVDDVVTAGGHRHHGLATSWQTLPKQLKECGYATGLSGKWHLGYDPKFNPVHHGFDEFHGYVSGNVDYFSHVDQTGMHDWWHGDQLVHEEGYTTHLITKHAVDFVERHHAEPFFLLVAHEAPHYPYQGPSDTALREEGDGRPSHGPRDGDAEAYAEMLTELDKGVGAVIDALQRHGVADNTLVIFTSDHGAPKGNGSNGPLRGHKNTLWEGGHRVPTCLHWPGAIDGGRASGGFVNTCDLFATVLDATNAPRPDHEVDGMSVLPHLRDGEAMSERLWFWRHRKQLAARRGTWKLIMPEGETGPRHLYNLADDIGESSDLAHAEPGIVEDLAGAVLAWHREIGETAMEPKLG